MKRVVSGTIIFLFFSTTLFAQRVCPLIPLPSHYEQTGDRFILNKNTTIVVKDVRLQSLAKYLQACIKKQNGFDLPIKNQGNENNIILEQAGDSTSAESYFLKMKRSSVVIGSATKEGLFDGISSFCQLNKLVAKKGQSANIDCWNIYDTARYQWRGLMLDESRHFFGKATVKMLLDWMAFYKLNRFHWHLTDEPGWRLQIQQYPRLTSVGAIGNFSDSSASAKYYTDQDIEEIVKYAKERFIAVIPEIDMPGHATASNRAYPQYSGGGTGKYANFTFNPGNNKTYSYLTNILKTVDSLFPSGMVHLGGDEVSFGIASWNDDPGVKTLMQQNNLPDLKSVEKYFIRRMEDSALTIFNKVLLWDEAADANLPVDSTIIMWWRHDKPEQSQKALDKGYEVVLCPRIPFYFDFDQDSSHRTGRKWQGDFASLQKLYEFPAGEPYHIDVNSKLILGVQGNLWTERISSEKRLEYMLFPRIAALAENAWTDRKDRNYSVFLDRLKTHLLWFRTAGISYYNPFNPAVTPEVIDK